MTGSLYRFIARWLCRTSAHDLVSVNQALLLGSMQIGPNLPWGKVQQRNMFNLGGWAPKTTHLIFWRQQINFILNGMGEWVWLKWNSFISYGFPLRQMIHLNVFWPKLLCHLNVSGTRGIRCICLSSPLEQRGKDCTIAKICPHSTF